MEDELIDSVVSLAVILIGIVVFFILWAGRAEAVEINMDIIKRIESSGNPHAFNASSGARGLYQVTPILVKEFNRMNNTGYRNDDMYIPVVCEKVAVWYISKRIPQMFKSFGIKDTVENRLIAYNAGIKAVKTGIVPRETRNYIRRYNRIREAI